MKTDASAVLAAERQEPYTAAEHAAERGLGAEFVRDVPRACICTWQWSPHERRYLVIRPWPGCPWHTPERQAQP